MRKMLIDALYNRGIFASRSVAVCDILSKMQLMHPVSTEIELIRIGGEGDGGYLVPNDLSNIQRCFSPGVAAYAGFEEELGNMGIRSFMADYSVDNPPIGNPNFHFEKRFLGSLNNDVFMTLDDWVSRLAPDEDHDMILQMDIEGAEYDTLLAAPTSLLKRFRIIIMEFHYLRDLMTPLGNQIVGNTFTKLSQTHAVVHSHPNNCGTPFRYKDAVFPAALEVTFLRKDRFTRSQPAKDFPHPLDRPCVPDLPDPTLPSCWWASEAGR